MSTSVRVLGQPLKSSSAVALRRRGNIVRSRRTTAKRQHRPEPSHHGDAAIDSFPSLSKLGWPVNGFHHIRTNDERLASKQQPSGYLADGQCLVPTTYQG
jgi:hypothetical protein